MKTRRRTRTRRRGGELNSKFDLKDLTQRDVKRFFAQVAAAEWTVDKRMALVAEEIVRRFQEQEKKAKRTS